MSADSQAIAARWQQLRAAVPEHVKIVAVSKTFSPEAIRAAYAAGARDFGESRLQEALPKQAALQDLAEIRWHFIGHLQGNKAKKALTHFDWIHTCDSLKLAQRLDRLVAETGQCPGILLQVKPLPDPDKYGWSLEQLQAELPALDRCDRLSVRGLMTILPQGLAAEEIAAAFAAVHDLAIEIRTSQWQHLSMEELSMGMSGDYSAAVAANATMIRLGRVLFGDRS
ncbi:MAG: YggS family pyridoxal phosphate-dependent enzyme [Cyanobacteria bacterium J06641_5]